MTTEAGRTPIPPRPTVPPRPTTPPDEPPPPPSARFPDVRPPVDQDWLLDAPSRAERPDTDGNAGPRDTDADDLDQASRVADLLAPFTEATRDRAPAPTPGDAASAERDDSPPPPPAASARLPDAPPATTGSPRVLDAAGDAPKRRAGDATVPPQPAGPPAPELPYEEAAVVPAQPAGPPASELPCVEAAVVPAQPARPSALELPCVEAAVVPPAPVGPPAPELACVEAVVVSPPPIRPPAPEPPREDTAVVPSQPAGPPAPELPCVEAAVVPPAPVGPPASELACVEAVVVSPQPIRPPAPEPPREDPAVAPPRPPGPPASDLAAEAAAARSQALADGKGVAGRRPFVSFARPALYDDTAPWSRPLRVRPRAVAAVACAVLGLGLIGGAVTGSWLTGESSATGSTRSAYAVTGELWHSLPVDRLFPPTLKGEGAGPGGADRSWTRVAVAPDSTCEAAFDPLLSKALAPVGCLRLLRATYTDATRSHVTTVGLLFTKADADGMRALRNRFTEEGLDRRSDLMPRSYPAKDTVAEGFGDAQRASWTLSVLPDAPVVAYAVSGFADGRTVTDPEPATEAMGSNTASAPAQSGLGHEAKGIADRVERGLRKSIARAEEV
ncbi:hypothetical protein ACOBQB_16670 [Streptomyces sp. G5(2025)]|uniref:hypothetical protein n=1 Tax=Streptomyces sp. G5(2025) TaxID=3406628 RepID=UPI003C1FA195